MLRILTQSPAGTSKVCLKSASWAVAVAGIASPAIITPKMVFLDLNGNPLLADGDVVIIDPASGHSPELDGTTIDLV